MRSSLPLVSLVLLAGACTPPPPLENANLRDVIPRFFSDFEGGEEAEALDVLVEVLERELVESKVDLDGEVSQRQFTLYNPDEVNGEFKPLGAAQLGGAKAPPGTDPAKQIAVVNFGRSRQDYATNVATLLESNQVCIESDTTVYYARSYVGGSAADFEAGTTDVLRSTNEVRKELSFLAAGWYDLYKDFRRVTLSDGREGVLGRSWIEAVFNGDGGGIFSQTFTAEAWIDDGEGGALRMYSFWGEIDIGLSNTAMRDLIADSLDEGFVRGDNFADDADPTDYCGQPRDRAYTRPEDTAE